MGLNNPDILFPLLEDLSQKVRNLNHRISYTLDDGEQLKNISDDQANQATFDTNYTANIKDSDESKIRYWDNETTSMFDKTNALISGISNTEGTLKRLLSACNQSIIYWNSQLATAQNKLLEWQAYFNKAVQGMNTAAAQEQSARVRYNNASSAYNRCINARDNKGRPVNHNCGGYQSEMNAAQAAINKARQDYQYWQQEKNKAETEIRRWQARIGQCSDSLGKLSLALNTTNTGLQSINEAANFARRSLEEINSAKVLIQKSKERNLEQGLLVTQNFANIQTAQVLSDDSKNSFIMANQLAGQVQFYGNCASEEINRKVDTLKEFSIIPNTL